MNMCRCLTRNRKRFVARDLIPAAGTLSPLLSTFFPSSSILLHNHSHVNTHPHATQEKKTARNSAFLVKPSVKPRSKGSKPVDKEQSEELSRVHRSSDLSEGERRNEGVSRRQKTPRPLWQKAYEKKKVVLNASQSARSSSLMRPRFLSVATSRSTHERSTICSWCQDPVVRT